MEGFLYSTLKAEVKRRESVAAERAAAALRVLLNDKYAVFTNIKKSAAVQSDEMHMNDRNGYGQYCGGYYFGNIFIQIVETRSAIETIETNASRIDKRFVFLANHWRAICEIRKCYLEELR